MDTQLPPDGTECDQTLMSGSGSGSSQNIQSGAPMPTNDNTVVNITGDVVATGNVYSLIPVQFGDEGYYVCVVETGHEQACFSNYVTVTGE